MTPEPHVLSGDDFAALSRGGGGARVMRALVAARRSRTLLLLRFIVGASTDGITRRAYEVLAHVRRIAPGATDDVLDHPAVGAWATRTALRLRAESSGATAELACIAVAAAIRGRVSVTVLMPPGPALSLPSLGTAVRRPAGRTVARSGPDGTDLGDGVWVPADWRRAGPGWHPLREIPVEHRGLGVRFLLDDWRFGAPPDDLALAGEVDLPTWRRRIAEGWQVLVDHHREVAEELVAAVTVLTPLRALRSGMSSSTVADAFGCLFLSLAPDPRSVALTFAHELQHTKLVALMDLFRLVDPADGERFYAPWRDDPRPVVGLLHGTYAFAGVTAFWQRQRPHETDVAARLHADTEFARWRVNALAAAQTLLTCGRLTTLGREFVGGILDLLEHHCGDPVPNEALERATRLSDAHRTRWLTTNTAGQDRSPG